MAEFEDASAVEPKRETFYVCLSFVDGGVIEPTAPQNKTSMAALQSKATEVTWQFVLFLRQLALFVEERRNTSSKDIKFEVLLFLRAEMDHLSGLVSGASKCVSYEHPRVNCRRFFVSERSMNLVPREGGGIATLALRLLNEVSGEDRDTLVTLRRHRFGRKTTVCQLSQLRANPIMVNKSTGDAALATYYSPTNAATESELPLIVVTGGMGALGSVLVDWLLDFHGVDPACVVILTRRQQSTEHPRGVKVVSVDISSSESLSNCAALQALAPRISGVFHLAGALRDGVLTKLEQESIAPVVSPKFGLFKLLKHVGRDGEELPWVVSFSSSTSLLGYPGQINYAAANGMLDHAAQFWRGYNGSMVTINWGPWAEVGMAKVGTKAYRQSLAHGELPMSTEESFEYLNEVLHSLVQVDMYDEDSPGLHSRQYLIARTKWEQSYWSNSNIPIRPRRRIGTGNFGAESTSGETSTGDEDRSNLGPEGQVEAFLKPRLSAWSLDDTLAAMGVDSLDEVQLRNEFENRFAGVRVPLSVFSQSLRKLIAQLAELIQQHS